MRYLIIITLTFLCSITAFSQRPKCIGSSNCNACTTCSGCQHCAKNGGTCGVCSSSTHNHKSTNNYSSGSSNSTENIPTDNSKSKFPVITYYIYTTLEVSVDTVNLRKGQGTEFEILAKLPKGTKLKVISTAKTRWIPVEVINTGMRGYVHEDYVR